MFTQTMCAGFCWFEDALPTGTLPRAQAFYFALGATINAVTICTSSGWCGFIPRDCRLTASRCRPEDCHLASQATYLNVPEPPGGKQQVRQTRQQHRGGAPARRDPQGKAPRVNLYVCVPPHLKMLQERAILYTALGCTWAAQLFQLHSLACCIYRGGIGNLRRSEAFK